MRNKIGEITWGTYLKPLGDFSDIGSNLGNGALLINIGYSLGKKLRFPVPLEIVKIEMVIYGIVVEVEISKYEATCLLENSAGIYRGCI